jgi:hypothetical protein
MQKSLHPLPGSHPPSLRQEALIQIRLATLKQ